MLSKAVTRYKLCECSKFSTLSSLVSITYLSVYWLVTTFIVRFGSQCTYSKKVMPLWGHLLGFVHWLFNCATKNFFILRSNYTTEVCLMLHEPFVSKAGLKCNCLVDFFTTTLPTTRACTSAHCCLLLKAGHETRPCD